MPDNAVPLGKWGLPDWVTDVVDIGSKVVKAIKNIGGGHGPTAGADVWANPAPVQPMPLVPTRREAIVSDNPYIPNVIEGIWNPDVANGDEVVPVRNIPGTGGGAVATTNGTYAGCKILLPVQQRVRHVAPPGYVVVRPPGADGRPGAPIAMLKRVAQTCGLWSPGAKPPITARDWKTLRRAAAVTNRLDRVVKTANKVTGKADMRRVRRSSSK